MTYKAGDRVVCNYPDGWEEIVNGQILTVVPNDKGLTFEGQEGKICLKFLEDWSKDFKLVENTEAKPMKIRITTSEFSYMGLHYNTLVKDAVPIANGVEFRHNGKDWSLLADNYEVVSDCRVENYSAVADKKEQYTGSSSDYYKVLVNNPTTLTDPYYAECNDIIEALEMDFAEGNAFKAIWRKAKARQGVKKKGYDNGVYDSEKVVFFGERMLVKAKEAE